MPANIMPIFPNKPVIQWGTVLTADAIASKNHDGTTGNAVCIFTAGVNGSRIDEISALSLGTNVATVLRIFINNGSVNTVAINNSLYKEITITAATISELIGLTSKTIIDKDSSALVLPPNYKIYAAVGTTVAAGIQVTVIGGDY
ncbi:MAG: hypothetical protein RR851_15130 [Clostridium sp.]